MGRKIAVHLARLQQFVLAAYGHERISACLRSDVLAWQEIHDPFDTLTAEVDERSPGDPVGNRHGPERDAAE